MLANLILIDYLIQISINEDYKSEVAFYAIFYIILQINIFETGHCDWCQFFL
jgi:hypothetical protein